MNILQDIDSTLHYENIEKAWNKYKYVFVFILVAIFAATAGYTAYTNSVKEASKADSEIIFKTVLNNATKPNYVESLNKALPSLKTDTGIETLKLELAKAYKASNNVEMFEKTLTELTDAKTKAIQSISTYMLAEHFLSTDAKLAIDFINNSKVSNKDFTYSLLQEVKAMAFISIEKTEEAKETYKSIIASEASQSIKDRAEFKLKQIK